MSYTIIDHALKISVRIIRVIIARYRDDCPRSKHTLINRGHPGPAELLEAQRACDILLVECSNAIHPTAMLHFDKVYTGNEIYVWFFSSIDMFFIQRTNQFAPAPRERKLDYRFLTYVR